MAAESLLEVDSFSHNFGDNQILNGVYLSLKTGTIAGLLGKNGCGKSTFLKCVFGSQKSRFGTVRIDNKFIPDRIVSGKIAYLPQSTFLPQAMKVKKAINLFLDADQRKRFPFNDQRLHPLMDSRVANLSGGEKRYLEFNLVLALGRPFIFLDEPFSEVEPIYSTLMIDKIRSLTSHCGFIVTDHDYRNVLKVSTSLYVMHGGQIHPVEGEDDLEKWGYLRESVKPKTYTERRAALRGKLKKIR